MSTITETTPLKFLTADGKGPHSGFAWPLPTAEGPGEWVRVKGPLVKCENGVHTCTLPQAAHWVDAALYVAETDGASGADDEKAWHRAARLVCRVEAWNEQTMRLWACDCAERVAHLANDSRCTNAIRVARRFAFGVATQQELEVARAAARAAARDAARDAARAAAWAAAWAAAGDAAWGAARAAAWDAARDAARDAAWDAAWAAARAAAWAAAWAAAGAVAGAAETKWQTVRLLAYLNGEVDLEAIKAGLAEGVRAEGERVA